MKKMVCFFALCALFAGISSGVWAGGRRAQDTAGGRTLTLAVGVEPVYVTNLGDQSSGDNDHVVMYNVFDTLFYRDAQGDIQPWLAESWEFTPDGKQLKVKLRGDVSFHDGSKLKSEDVKFTYDYLKDKPLGKSLLINYDYTEVVDDQNFVIHLTDAFKPILSSFASRIAIVLSKSYYDRVGKDTYDKAPIGTGAYKFVEWRSGDSIIMDRNDSWWGWSGKADKAQSFQRVIIKVIPEVNTQVLALESGDVDVVLAIPLENLQRINNSRVTWESIESNAMNFFQFNMQASRYPAQDLNFRKAVQYGIDKEAINRAVFGNTASIIDMYGSLMFTGRPQPGSYTAYTHDVATAKDYLSKSQYKGQEIVVYAQSGTPNAQVAEVIQGSLRDVGINIRVVAVDPATFFDVVRNTGAFDAEVVINTSSIMDMDTLSNYFFIDRYDFRDMAHPRGQRMDELIRMGRREPDDNKRVGYFREFTNILNEDVNHIYILMDINTIAYRNDRIQGVKANAFKYYRFAEWSTK